MSGNLILVLVVDILPSPPRRSSYLRAPLALPQLVAHAAERPAEEEEEHGAERDGDRSDERARHRTPMRPAVRPAVRAPRVREPLRAPVATRSGVPRERVLRSGVVELGLRVRFGLDLGGRGGAGGSMVEGVKGGG